MTSTHADYILCVEEVNNYGAYQIFPPLLNWILFVGLRAFEDKINRIVRGAGTAVRGSPPVDIVENENELVVKADVPDVKFEDIDVKMEKWHAHPAW